MDVRRMIVAAVVLALTLSVPVATAAAKQPPPPSSDRPPVTCSHPVSDAVSLEILDNYYPGYWWDHTDLTIAVQAPRRASPALLDAVHGALDTWDAVLRDCFDGLITLTDVTRSQASEQRAADIVVHYVPTAGGVSFGGYAICGDHGCPNVLVTSDLPKGRGGSSYTPEYMGWLTLHEVGHALGLGHATNLLESTDLMGYGWPEFGDPVLSQCDVEALAFVFAWAVEGDAPHPPGGGPFTCSTD